jgi:hypothetical protein
MTDTEVQPALPTLELPEFEGFLPVGVVTKLTGAGERIGRAIHHNDRVVLIVEAELVDVRHPKTKDGIKRHQVLKVADLYELEGAEGKRLLTMMREAYRKADDQRHNRKAITDGVGTIRVPAGLTDDHGHPLDEAALAEVRGDRLVQAMADPGLDPVVVVFDDRSSTFWPDDFPPGTAKPAPGSFVGDLQVREWLDPDSEDVVAEWTDEEEDTRLAALEAEALAEEAAGNRAAVDELLAGRERARGAPDGELELDDEGPELEEPWDGYATLGVVGIKNRVSQMTDRDRVFEVAAFEKANKGRKGVLEVCERRAAELFSDDVPRAELDAEPTGFEVPPDAIEDEDEAEDLALRQHAAVEPAGDDE